MNINHTGSGVGIGIGFPPAVLPDSGAHVVISSRSSSSNKQNPVQARLAAVAAAAATVEYRMEHATLINNNNNKETTGSPTPTTGGSTNNNKHQLALRSEQKRIREKQRRTDVNQQFEELTNVIIRLNSVEQKIQQEMGFSSSMATPFIPSSRVELIARSIAQLERLPRVIKKQKMEIVSLEQQVVVAQKTGEEVAWKMKLATAAVSKALNGSSTMAHRVISDMNGNNGSSSFDGKNITRIMSMQPRGVGGKMLALPSNVSCQNSRNTVMNNGMVSRKTHRVRKNSCSIYIYIYI